MTRSLSAVLGLGALVLTLGSVAQGCGSSSSNGTGGSSEGTTGGSSGAAGTGGTSATGGSGGVGGAGAGTGGVAGTGGSAGAGTGGNSGAGGSGGMATGGSAGVGGGSGTGGSAGTGGGSGTGGSSGTGGTGGNSNVVVLASGQSLPWEVVLDASNVYWPDTHGAVRKVPKTGGASQLLGSATGIGGIATDGVNVYVANNPLGGSTVASVPVSGGSMVDLATGYSEVRDVGTDGAYVYFTTPNAVMKVQVAGGTATTIATAHDPLYIAVADGYVYWMDRPNSTSLVRVPVTGGTVETVSSVDPYLGDISVDSTNVYLAINSPDDAVKQVVKSGGTAIDIGGSLNSPTAVASDGTNVYFTTAPVPDTGAVMKVPIGGGTVTTVADGQQDAEDVAVDATSVYWVDGMGGMVLKAPK